MQGYVMLAKEQLQLQTGQRSDAPGVAAPAEPAEARQTIPRLQTREGGVLPRIMGGSLQHKTKGSATLVAGFWTEGYDVCKLFFS